MASRQLAGALPYPTKRPLHPNPHGATRRATSGAIGEDWACSYRIPLLTRPVKLHLSKALREGFAGSC